nr:MAG TPA: hypothetical protein [Caudoviricetes sp.]
MYILWQRYTLTCVEEVAATSSFNHGSRCYLVSVRTVSYRYIIA